MNRHPSTEPSGLTIWAKTPSAAVHELGGTFTAHPGVCQERRHGAPKYLFKFVIIVIYSCFVTAPPGGAMISAVASQQNAPGFKFPNCVWSLHALSVPVWVLSVNSSAILAILNWL